MDGQCVVNKTDDLGWRSYVKIIEDVFKTEYDALHEAFSRSHLHSLDGAINPKSADDINEPCMMTLAQTDLVESFLEDALYNSAILTLEGLLSRTVCPTAELIGSLITHVLDYHQDFPSLRVIATLERIKFIHGCTPFKFILDDSSRDMFPVDRHDKPSLQTFWAVFSKSWDLFKEGKSNGEPLKKYDDNGLMSIFHCKRIKSLALKLRPSFTPKQEIFAIFKEMIVKGPEFHKVSTMLASEFIYDLIMIFFIADITCRSINIDLLVSILDELSADEVFIVINTFPTCFRAYVAIHYLEKKSTYVHNQQQEPPILPLKLSNANWTIYTLLIRELFSVITSVIYEKKGTNSPAHYNAIKEAFLRDIRSLSTSKDDIKKLEDFLVSLSNTVEVINNEHLSTQHIV